MYQITSPLNPEINEKHRTLKDLKKEYPTWFAYYRTTRTKQGLRLTNGRGEIVAEIVKVQ